MAGSHRSTQQARSACMAGATSAGARPGEKFGSVLNRQLRAALLLISPRALWSLPRLFDEQAMLAALFKVPFTPKPGKTGKGREMGLGVVSQKSPLVYWFSVGVGLENSPWPLIRGPLVAKR
jgi:hypothetical protein